VSARKAVFLDRDGTLNVEVPLVATPDDLTPIEGIGPAVRAINEAGFLAILLTNQAAVARGDCAPASLRRIHGKLRGILAHDGAHLDAIYVCPHHPGYGSPCNCRKPKPGMIFAAQDDFDIDLARSWVIGDSAKDVQLARNAGVRSALVRTGKAGSDIGTDDMTAIPDAVFETLNEAVAFATGREAVACATGHR
jgi:D-glycero-D-manno-heptose 1,7-bisphosphate phosphatase